MARPVFGVDRDPLAAATWGQPRIADDEWQEEFDGFCEIHGDNRAACEAFEQRAQAEQDQARIAAGVQPDPNERLSLVYDHGLGPDGSKR